jgi:hypothetical protein
MNPFGSEPWPNSLDAALTAAFLATVVLVPAAGYVFMALDFAAYLRSLRRGLIVMGRYFSFPEIPDWARHHTPRAVAALGLRMPCTQDDLKRAYRARVKQLHPDHGGDERRFLILQANFEEAMALVRSGSTAGEARWPAHRHAT